MKKTQVEFEALDEDGTWSLIVDDDETVRVPLIRAESLLALDYAARRLSKLYLPQVNHGASFMNDEAFAALNEFEIAVRKSKKAGLGGGNGADL